MLFPAEAWPGIADGSITVAFRAWKRPTVKAGGTLITPAGQLAIDEVAAIDLSEVTDDDARLAGAADAGELVAGLSPTDGRRLHRIRFRRIGDDPRIALGARPVPEEERAELERRLAAMDARADRPWTRDTLARIAAHPGVVSTRLAAAAGVERDVYKRRVRRLKELGLTESLEVGYRLTVRGESLVTPVDPS